MLERLAKLWIEARVNLIQICVDKIKCYEGTRVYGFSAAYSWKRSCLVLLLKLYTLEPNLSPNDQTVSTRCWTNHSGLIISKGCLKSCLVTIRLWSKGWVLFAVLQSGKCCWERGFSSQGNEKGHFFGGFENRKSSYSKNTNILRRCSKDTSGEVSDGNATPLWRRCSVKSFRRKVKERSGQANKGSLLVLWSWIEGK